jgi:hypothetical protein
MRSPITVKRHMKRLEKQMKSMSAEYKALECEYQKALVERSVVPKYEYELQPEDFTRDTPPDAEFYFRVIRVITNFREVEAIAKKCGTSYIYVERQSEYVTYFIFDRILVAARYFQTESLYLKTWVILTPEEIAQLKACQIPERLFTEKAISNG